MSTDLYGVRVLALEPDERRVRLRVFVVYYDVAAREHLPLPDDPSFFFRVLWEGADSLTGGADGPLYEHVTVAQFLDESWVDAHTHRFVSAVTTVAVRNHPLGDGDYEDFHDFYYAQDGHWQDEDRLVQADYDVHVTDARWLASLRVGQSWGSTSYATSARPLEAGSET